MSILKYLIPFILVLLPACSAKVPPPEFREYHIGVIPVFVNNGGEDISEDFLNRLSAGMLIAQLELERDLKIVLDFDDPLILNSEMEIACPFEFPPLEFDSPFRKNIVLFINIPNQCINLLGCAGLSAIAEEDATAALITADQNSINTAMVLIHEVGHILGATHTNDMHVMTSSQQWTMFIDFSQASKDQILKVLIPLYEQMDKDKAEAEAKDKDK